LKVAVWGKMEGLRRETEIFYRKNKLENDSRE
jgi:hypothetical protein